MAVDPDYFVNVDTIHFFVLPFSWGLLPTAAFAPHILVPHLPEIATRLMLMFQVRKSTIAETLYVMSRFYSLCYNCSSP